MEIEKAVTGNQIDLRMPTTSLDQAKAAFLRNGANFTVPQVF